MPGCPDNNPVCDNPANVGRFGNAGVNILSTPGHEEPGSGADEGVPSHRAQDAAVPGHLLGRLQPPQLRLSGRGHQFARYRGCHHQHELELPERVFDVRESSTSLCDSSSDAANPRFVGRLFACTLAAFPVFRAGSRAGFVRRSDIRRYAARRPPWLLRVRAKFALLTGRAGARRNALQPGG